MMDATTVGEIEETGNPGKYLDIAYNSSFKFYICLICKDYQYFYVFILLE